MRAAEPAAAVAWAKCVAHARGDRGNRCDCDMRSSPFERLFGGPTSMVRVESHANDSLVALRRRLSPVLPLSQPREGRAISPESLKRRPTSV